MEMTGTPFVAAERGTAAELSHAGRVGRRRVGLSWGCPTAAPEATSTFFSWSLSSSSLLWLFHWKPRPIEVTPQLLPTLAARYKGRPEGVGGIQSSSLSKERSTVGAASIMPRRGGRARRR